MDFQFGKHFFKHTVCSEYRVTPRKKIRNTYIQVSEFDRARIIVFEFLFRDWSTVALVDIHLLPGKYVINGLMKVILNSMQDLNALP